MEAVTRGALGKGGLIGLVFLAGCSSTPVAEQPAPRTVELAEQNQPIGTRMPQADTDLCKAGEFQWLVGRPRTEIPVPVEVVNRRVACTACPVTEDYSPYRLNIFYNSQSDLVEQVRCG